MLAAIRTPCPVKAQGRYWIFCLRFKAAICDLERRHSFASASVKQVSILTFDTVVRTGSVTLSQTSHPAFIALPGKATSCDIKATSMRVGSQAVGTPKPPQCDPQATLRLQQSANKAWRRTTDDGGKAETLKAES
jgi:hypothetical protein